MPKNGRGTADSLYDEKDGILVQMESAGGQLWANPPRLGSADPLSPGEAEECCLCGAVTTTVPCQWHAAQGKSPTPYCLACVAKLRSIGILRSMYRVRSLEVESCLHRGRLTRPTRSICQACGRY